MANPNVDESVLPCPSGGGIVGSSERGRGQDGGRRDRDKEARKQGRLVSFGGL